jgi:hypothetical protein
MCADPNRYHVRHMIKVMELVNIYIIIENSAMMETRKLSSNYDFCRITACYQLK